MTNVLQLPEQVPNVRVQPPMVFVREEARWEYKHLARNLAEEPAPTEADLNALGAEGWELAGVFSDSLRVHCYFKRPAA